MTVIILINWNGADDTLACLRSLAVAEGDFRVVVGDNGSSDDSVERIQAFLGSDEWRQMTRHDAEVKALGKNWGFAVGNNKVIRYARRYQPDSYMLLNNDTEVEPDFMARLQEYRLAHPDVKVVGPLVCYWAEKDRIWSCGGRLTFGTRKGYFKESLAEEMSDRSPLPVTFISGCALLADASLIDDEGRLLTERFFFGEEDYEFAHRMRRAGERMAIVREAVVYHKVGRSMVQDTPEKTSSRKLGRDYMYYLGRFIVARMYYSPLQFRMILLLSLPRCYKYFKADGLSSSEAFRLTFRLRHNAHTKEGITYDDFKNLTVKPQID